MPVQQQSLDGLNTDHLQADLRGRSVRGGVVNVASQGGTVPNPIRRDCGAGAPADPG